jgi:hypothetical protein
LHKLRAAARLKSPDRHHSAGNSNANLKNAEAVLPRNKPSFASFLEHKIPATSSSITPPKGLFDAGPPLKTPISRPFFKGVKVFPD